MKNIHSHHTSLNLLYFVDIVLFDVETAHEKTKLVILDGLELQTSSPPLRHVEVGEGRGNYEIFIRNIFGYFTKTKRSSINNSNLVNHLFKRESCDFHVNLFGFIFPVKSVKSI